ncbi:hypothetical protein [Chromobacterium aquaticum]|uniref:Uncharacterized protein n=1 Tax=Chromobacterium aquaticum TaxID=467180 RepID=A0ABV8ZXM3_9NEIS|nr:hypothetical protein [Chromobacterium aquaticum]MCD5360430.1 hypothetical protein [Chromobacterium aquaticum]
MTKTTKIILALLVAFATVIAIAFNTSNKSQESPKKMTPSYPSNIELAMYQHGDDWQKKYPTVVAAETQNFGLNFYKAMNFDPNALPSVTINAGETKTVIPKVLSISATEEKNRSPEIISIFITARVKNGGAMSHDEARLYILDLIEKFTAAGWKIAFSFNKPRLSGIHALNYYGADALDPNYKLSLAEWMQLDGSLNWKLYLNHTYMRVTVDRDQDHLDPNKPGAYIISLTIEPHEEVQRMYVDQKERDHWRQLWIPIARKLRSERNIKEATLKAQGIPIVSDYKDPELPPAPPGQQNPVIPKDLQ